MFKGGGRELYKGQNVNVPKFMLKKIAITIYFTSTSKYNGRGIEESYLHIFWCALCSSESTKLIDSQGKELICISGNNLKDTQNYNIILFY